MAKKNVSTAENKRSVESKYLEILLYISSASPAERESYLAQCIPAVASAARAWLVKKEAFVAEQRKIKAPPALPNSVQRELIVLDFKEYALIEALDMLREMAVAGEINGLIFAAKYTQPGERRHFFGAEGRFQGNIDEALGAATQLQMDIAKQAASE